MKNLSIRPIQPSDNPILAQIIRSVLTEFGANKPGFAFADPYLGHLFEHYQKQSKSQYFVLYNSTTNEVFGGAGIGHLLASYNQGSVCELQKMYFLAAVRNLGLGQKILDECLRFARAENYSYCYLETLHSLSSAKKLYTKNGFQRLERPLLESEHFSCDEWFIKKL